MILLFALFPLLHVLVYSLRAFQFYHDTVTPPYLPSVYAELYLLLHSITPPDSSRIPWLSKKQQILHLVWVCGVQIGLLLGLCRPASMPSSQGLSCPYFSLGGNPHLGLRLPCSCWFLWCVLEFNYLWRPWILRGMWNWPISSVLRGDRQRVEHTV